MPHGGVGSEVIVVFVRIHLPAQGHLAQIIHALDALCALLGPAENRQQNRRQNGDNGDNREQFNEREGASWSHTI
jgi:hypothetical protein